MNYFYRLEEEERELERINVRIMAAMLFCFLKNLNSFQDELRRAIQALENEVENAIRQSHEDNERLEELQVTPCHSKKYIYFVSYSFRENLMCWWQENRYSDKAEEVFDLLNDRSSI